MQKLIILVALFSCISCSNNDDAGDVRTNEFEVINTVLPQGEWKVDYFYRDSEDHTLDFETFVFKFKGDGTVQAQTDLFTGLGTWLYDNAPEKPEKLILIFSESVPFDSMNHDWKIISVGTSKVELSYETNSDEDTELLSFVKI